LVVTAAEIIEQIKALPRSEQQHVINFAAELQKAPPDVRYITNEQFEKAADEVFSKHAELFRRPAAS